MKGIELSEKFYNEYGVKMLEEQFSDIVFELAIGLAGSGSECFGWDDEISRDHDFEPGFCIFITDSIDRKTAFALERAYAKLPREFMGFKRSTLSPVGGNRHGVINIGDFLLDKTGTPDGSLSLLDWMNLPEQSVAEAVNGKIFRDDSGVFTSIREELTYMPEEIRLKKLSGELLMMGQTGQYNFPRCLARGEHAAAQLTLNEFVKHSLHAVFLLNKHYLPYYKWCFRALKDLSKLSHLSKALEELLFGNSADIQNTVESVCLEIISEARNQNLTTYHGNEAEGHAYSVNDKIENEEIRNMHILSGV
ncbi:MAG: DUF4037 domain-containing protein [Ruminococcaceae bacterium]|nr:DUF4037 domain-containing protein [Oscillospiraceae bacterium]